MKTVNQAYEEFPDEVRKKFVEATNYVLDNFIFKAWNEQEMKEKWRRRSLDQILESGEINHLFPCVDAGVVAAKYLHDNGENVRLNLLTERGAVDAFRKGKASALHIDALVELPFRGVNYGLDIGCGDVILYKPVLSGSSDPLEKKYLTTRPEEHERYWDRTPFLIVDGLTLVRNQFTPILNFLDTGNNKIVAPYGIKKGEFHRAPSVGDKKSFLVTNEDYDSEASSADNKGWLTENLQFLPGLREYRYSE